MSFRSVDALTGEIAGTPSKFIEALSEADRVCADLDTLEELREENAQLRCRLQELGERA